VLSISFLTTFLSKEEKLTKQNIADNRLGIAEFTVPAHTPGPPAHWHEMHDETYFVTRGTIRFHVPGQADVDARAGDFVVVPIRAPHTFSNPTGTEARFINTFTPAIYLNYFKLLGAMARPGEMVPRDVSVLAMSSFATLLVPLVGGEGAREGRVE
jgi:mannose-6-phosphate isomerase-like protein (cupin superfamily)